MSDIKDTMFAYRLAVSEYLAMPPGEQKDEQEGFLHNLEEKLKALGVDL